MMHMGDSYDDEGRLGVLKGFALLAAALAALIGFLHVALGETSLETRPAPDAGPTGVAVWGVQAERGSRVTPFRVSRPDIELVTSPANEVGLWERWAVSAYFKGDPTPVLKCWEACLLPTPEKEGSPSR